MADEALVVEGLTYTYPGADLPALEDVSFTVERGEFLGVAGPTGAGKSTLLKCLSGVIPHHGVAGELAGEVRVLGRPVTDYRGLGEVSAHVGLVLQDPEVQLVNAYVREELAWGLENRGTPVPEIAATVERVAATFALTGLLDRLTHNLSGGEKQRVAVASVFALSPDVMLLDEPTSELDPAGASMVFDSARLLTEEGLTVVMVEHRMEDLAEHADSLLVLDEGQVVATGPPLSVLADPDHEIVAEYRPQVLELALRLGDDGVRLEPTPLTVAQAVAAVRSHQGGGLDGR